MEFRSGALHADPNALHQWRFRLARLREKPIHTDIYCPDGLFEQSTRRLGERQIQAITFELS